MNISCRITTTTGSLELNDGQRFKLAGDTLAERQVRWRRNQVTSPFVHGTYTVSAVQDNVMEQVAVYAYGTSNNDLRSSLAELESAFSQPVYSLNWVVGDDSYAWRCERADYRVDTRREFQHATIALVTFQVSRYPAVIEA